jgi:hypothetical protein
MPLGKRSITEPVIYEEEPMKKFAFIAALLFAIPAYAVTYQGGKCVKDCMTDAEWEAHQRAVYTEACGIEIPAGKSILDVVLPVGCAGDSDDSE